MPFAYPPAAPSVSGDLLTISRYLQDPARLQRRLRTYQDLRFVSDQILTGRMRSQGGAVLYDTSEPFLTDRTVEAVGAGSEYPYAQLATGAAAIAAIQNWGQKVLLTDRALARSVYQGQELDRQLRKVVNAIIKQVDAVTMSLINSQVTNAFGASGTWSATSNILGDILGAAAQLEDLNLGYRANVVLLPTPKYAMAMSNQNLTNAWRRETTENPVYTGRIEQIGGLTIIKTAASNMPGGATTPWVFDTTQLGAMADEVDGAPGYAVSDLGVQVQSIRLAGRDAWDLQGRRLTVPLIQEPAAGVKITGA